MWGESAINHIATENDITREQALFILDKSEKLMPILLIQYKTDINMICKKMKEYQRLHIANCKK